MFFRGGGYNSRAAISGASTVSEIFFLNYTTYFIWLEVPTYVYTVKEYVS